MLTNNKLPITIVLPCRNERKNLEILLPKLDGLAQELIIVDGHSTDGTAELAKKYSAKFVLDNGKGKGDGIRVGISHATQNICLFLDADLSHDPQEIPRMVEPLLRDQADLVLGSRMRGGGDEFVAIFNMLVRLFGNMILSWIINLRCHSKLSDTQNGFRAGKTSLFRSLDLICNKHTIETEITMRALRAKARVVEVPTHEYARRFGSSSLLLLEQTGHLLFVYLRECFRPVKLYNQ